ncbi:hypothetical protein V496_08999 [Pseudogymnoascus sp. VKM F-4515 (FW-2607)]|nr:hypothetical protein V496_08999 [Pseudogymnoascus sp. VKM F-4515 (FW-2607)]
MSLVPFSSRDSREIVLQHDDAIVVRDPQTRQLILRGASAAQKLSECPYCHQSIRSTSPDDGHPLSNAPSHGQSFVNPEYFRMLRLASEPGSEDEREPPSSPIRRLTQPVPRSGPYRAPSAGGHRADTEGIEESDDAEFVTSTPAGQSGRESLGIKKDAFSPNYFQKFFTVESELGRGGKGVVLLVRHELDGVFLGHFACKRVPVGDDHEWLEKVLIEVQLLQQLSHPNLVSYRHVWLEDFKLNRFGPSVPCAFILQQYCNSGDLLHYVIGKGATATSSNEELKAQMRRRSKGQLDRPQGLKSPQKKLAFDEIYSFFKDITSGLAHLHASNYIHRDLKPSNCLLHRGENELRCLISDFGEVQAENVYRKSTGATGTISYCAPEVLRRDTSGRYGNFTAKSDIFSLGMILYFMCFGRLPYLSAENIQEEFEDLDQLRAEISSWQGFRDERQERPDLPDQLYTFLKRLLSINPADRPSATDILQAISSGSGLEGAPSLTRAKNNLNVGKRIQPVDSPVPGAKSSDGTRSVSAAYIEDEDGERVHALRKTLSNHLDSQPEVTTPLLMPPPSGRVGRFNQHLALASHSATSWIRSNGRLLTYAAKFVIFLFKAYTLTKPCLPWASNPLVSAPLLMLAAVDLVLVGRLEGRMTTLLLLAHVVAMSVASRYGSLCASGRDMWEWEAAVSRRDL